jgi:opacity protein-like surface antigen
MVLLLCLQAGAQEAPKADVFLGYSYVRVNPATSGASSFNLNGGSGSIAFNPSRSLGLVGEFSGYHVGEIGGVPVKGTVVTYLFGPRLSYRAYDRVNPFAHVLFGGAHGSASALGLSSSDNAFAMTAGGGFDVKLTDRVAWRLAQVD